MILPKVKDKSLSKFKKQIREAVANYIRTEGCGCCSASDHSVHEETIAKLLNVPKYKDGSGYDFSKFVTR